MDELIPITRIESFLDGIVNGSAVPDPETRIETFLAKIAGENVVTPEPITRIEVFLAKISGVDIPIPQPITRIEMFLAKISGEDIVPPNPITRIEMYLAKWAEGGSDPLNTFTGAIVRFLAKRAKPIVKLTANFTPIQGGTGDPSPTNIRPISGHTGCEVTREGKNLCPVAEDSRNPFMIWGAGQNDLKSAINSLPSGTYTITIKYKIVELPVSGSVSYGAYATKSGGTLIGYSVTTDNSPTVGKVYTVSKTFTLAEADVGTVTNFYMYCDNSSTHSGTTGRGLYNAYDFQIESGSTASDYEPYSGTTVSISFGTTVYGCQLTVNEDGSGQVIDDHYMVDLSTAGASAVMINGYPCVSVVVTSLKDSAKKTDVICSHLPFLGNTASDVKPFGIVNRTENYYNVSFCAPDLFTTVAEFRSWASANNVQMLAPLDTPITIPLTASQISTLVGTNTVWVNDATGDITIQAYGTAIT